MKKVQVLMSSYNGEKYIKQQIESIFNQQNVLVECIVRDDGSTDKTKEILKELAKRYSNLKLIEGENIGWKKSFCEVVKYYDKNIGYFAFADQDDVWLPNKLTRGIEELEKIKEEKAKLYYSDVYLVNENLDIIGKKRNLKPPKFKEESLFKCYGQGCTMIFNKLALELFLKSNSLKEEISHEYWISVLCVYFGKVIYDKNYCSMYYRQHNSNIFGANRKNNLFLLKKGIKNFFSKKNNYSFFCGKELYEEYGELLMKDEKEFIYNLLIYKSSLKIKIKLLFDSRIKRYTFLGTVFLKLNILCSRF